MRSTSSALPRSMNRTNTACPQEHTYAVMRLALIAQQRASLTGYAQ